jgi:hypothetical protein
LLYARELLAEPRDPYRAASEWLAANARAGEVALVVPDYMQYPLMFHVPGLRFAWQFSPDKKAAYPSLPPWFFSGEVAPDWIVEFGDQDAQLGPVASYLERRGVAYELAANLPVFGREAYRPELFWRSFGEIAGFDKKREGIRLFRRKGAR